MCVLAACLLAGLGNAVFAADDAGATERAKQVENRIKAAFLYHFCSYVLWPDETFEHADDPLMIGVIGPESVVAEIDNAVSGRLAHGHPMTVRRIEAGDRLDDVHLLFIDASADVETARLVARLANRAVLVVTDHPAGLDTGGVINFVIENDRVRFDVALDAARERDLRVSAQLLTVAREIRGARD